MPRGGGERGRARSRHQGGTVTSSKPVSPNPTATQRHWDTLTHTPSDIYRQRLKYTNKTPTPLAPSLSHRAVHSEPTLVPNTQPHLPQLRLSQVADESRQWSGSPLSPQAPWIFRGGPTVGSGDRGLVLHRTQGLQPALSQPGERTQQLWEGRPASSVCAGGCVCGHALCGGFTEVPPAGHSLHLVAHISFPGLAWFSNRFVSVGLLTPPRGKRSKRGC